MISDYLPKIFIFLLALLAIAIALVRYGRGRLLPLNQTPGPLSLQVLDRKIVGNVSLMVVQTGQARVLVTKSGQQLVVTLLPDAHEETRK